MGYLLRLDVLTVANSPTLYFSRNKDGVGFA